MELEAQVDQRETDRPLELVAAPKANRREPWALSHVGYRARNGIERYFDCTKRLRGIADRYHKLDHFYLNQVLLGCIHFMTKQSEHALASLARAVRSLASSLHARPTLD